MIARRAVQVAAAPRAIGPYSQAQVVETGGVRWLYSAGQVGLDPASGALVPGGVAEQAERALANLAAVLEDAGMTFADVVKTTVYLADMRDFEAMNQVYTARFGAALPARTTIAAAGLPRGARVEIDVVAVRAT